MQTLNTGSLAWATASALAYLYMVMSWGGYSFIINLLPIHCLACVFTGRLSHRLYVAYAPLIVMGTIGAGETFAVSKQLAWLANGCVKSRQLFSGIAVSMLLITQCT